MTLANPRNVDSITPMVGQIQERFRVACVEDGCQEAPCRQGLDQPPLQLIIENETGCGLITWHQA
jgi:hypothetical protein